MNQGELAKIVKQTTGSSWSVPHRHVRSACRILEEDEVVLSAAPCRREKRFGLIVVSNIRLFFVALSGFRRTNVQELPIKSIKAMHYEFGPYSGSVDITGSGSEFCIKDLQKSGVLRLTSAIRQALEGSKSKAPKQEILPPEHGLSLDFAKRLRRPRLISRPEPHHPSLIEELSDAG